MQLNPWLLLATTFIQTVVLAAAGVLLWKLLSQQTNQYQLERTNWERERERLLNRTMTKEWQSYIQMQAAMSPSSNSILNDTEPARGLSDEEELRRYAHSMSEQPVGDVMVDFTSELEELGLKQESE